MADISQCRGTHRRRQEDNREWQIAAQFSKETNRLLWTGKWGGQGEAFFPQGNQEAFLELKLENFLGMGSGSRPEKGSAVP